MRRRAEELQRVADAQALPADPARQALQRVLHAALAVAPQSAASRVDTSDVAVGRRRRPSISKFSRAPEAGGMQGSEAPSKPTQSCLPLSFTPSSSPQLRRCRLRRRLGCQTLVEQKQGAPHRPGHRRRRRRRASRGARGRPRRAAGVGHRTGLRRRAADAAVRVPGGPGRAHRAGPSRGQVEGGGRDGDQGNSQKS